jgi:DNA-binding response OmpR family regulator
MELRHAQPPVTVIAMSGGGRETGWTISARARLMGAAKVLLKPFTIAALIAAIDELLPGDVYGAGGVMPAAAASSPPAPPPRSPRTGRPRAA